MNGDTKWHFWVMMLASFILFLGIIYLILKREEFFRKKSKIIGIAFMVVGIGMAMGKFGTGLGLPWWIYYPVPLLLTFLLPPFALHFRKRQWVVYILLSSLSAPFIHFLFSFFLNWKEYLPFWNIPSIQEWAGQ